MNPRDDKRRRNEQSLTPRQTMIAGAAVVVAGLLGCVLTSLVHAWHSVVDGPALFVVAVPFVGIGLVIYGAVKPRRP